MADRNERHFLEFYTPARQRINLRAARRQLNTERQQKHRTTTASDDKENPSNDHCDFRSVPATVPGDKAVGSGHQRRRLFTRSTSRKQNNDDGDVIVKNTMLDSYGVNVNAGKDLSLASLHASEFSSPTEFESSASRVLFSTELEGSPVDGTVEEKFPSENGYSLPSNSNLLKEYRCKESLLSSSTTRISAFSSPISGGIRLRPSALWKRGRGHKKRDDDQKKNLTDTPFIAVTKTSETKNLVVGLPAVTTTLASVSSHNDIATNSSHSALNSTKTSPMTPKSTPKRHGFWSPPGTSRLLRKYRQRIQQSNQDNSAFLSPESGESTSEIYHNRSLTTPRGRKGLRLMESGAKRCRNHRLSLRPRPAVSTATTPAGTKVVANVEESSEKSETSDNRSLLSPLTAKRLEKDILSYRKAHGRSIKAVTNECHRPEDAKKLSVEEDIVHLSDGNDSENYSLQHKNMGSEMELHPKSSPDSTDSGNDEGRTENSAPNRIMEDSLPLDEHDVVKKFVENDNQPPKLEPSVKVVVAEDGSNRNTSYPEVIVANPSDEVSVESGVFRSTRSAIGRRFMQDEMKLTSSPDKIILDTSEAQETEVGVFRSTRSATKARQKALQQGLESVTVAKTASANLKVGLRKNGAITPTTRSTICVHRKSIQDTVEADSASTISVASFNNDQNESSGIARSIDSSTSSRRKSNGDSAGAVSTKAVSIANANGDQDEQIVRSTSSGTRAHHESSPETITENRNDGNCDINTSGVFRSTRSATRARRKSLLEMERAVAATDAALSGKKEKNSIDNSASMKGDVIGDSNVVSTALASHPNDENNTPSSKGSLQSIWNALHCGSGDSSSDSIPPPEAEHDGSVHATIVSRVGDCVNPMAATLMKMWKEEEKDKKKKLEYSQNETTKNICDHCPESELTVTVAPSATSAEDKDNGVDPSPFCGLKVSPPKSFSSDLNLVYGLERVQNLTLARPKALQATRSLNGEPLSILSPSTSPNPLTSCS